jgi:hypothetical protein
MKHAVARQGEGEDLQCRRQVSWVAAALGDASDAVMPTRRARNRATCKSVAEIGVDKRTTVVFPAPLMTSIAELGAFLARGRAAAGPVVPTHRTLRFAQPWTPSR